MGMTRTTLDEVMKSSDSDDTPDDCEWGGCDHKPEYRIKFIDPEEWVYYCHDHFHEMKDDKRVVKWDLV